MKPLQHAKISAKKHGGKWEDYIDIHEFFDQTKAHIPDMRHRAILHNSLGIYIAQQVFGEVRTNSAGREYSVRDIGEDHVLEDLGTIPSMASIIECIDTKHLKWLGGLPKNKRTLVTKIPRKTRGDHPRRGLRPADWRMAVIPRSAPRRARKGRWRPRNGWSVRSVHPPLRQEPIPL